jgi:hypothetical protein
MLLRSQEILPQQKLYILWRRVTQFLVLYGASLVWPFNLHYLWQEIVKDKVGVHSSGIMIIPSGITALPFLKRFYGTHKDMLQP